MAFRDDDLATAFIARDPSAFDRAYAVYGRDLRAVAENVLADRAAAEDCLHDALLRVWGTPDSYRPERGSLRTFLIVCVRNEALSVLRGDRRRSAREERAQRLGPVSETTTIEVPDHVEARRIRDALATLPDEQRLALERVYYANRTQVEAAADLGIPLGTLKTRVSAGVRRLHAALAGGAQ
jgi:RNA polymerase sigma-70 factor (ECF subfamily)